MYGKGLGRFEAMPSITGNAVWTGKTTRDKKEE
jgi:hypothetical protein